MTRRSSGKSWLALNVTASCVLAAGVAMWSPFANALSFGGEQITSYLGQPLRLAIPLLGATGDSLDARCFRVVTPLRSDGLTAITQARVELQTTSNPPLLIVRSNRSVDDPAVRLTIEAGCDNPIRRDYTLLLDPPPLQAAEPVRAASVLTPPVSSGISVNVNESVPPASSAAKAAASAVDRDERRNRARVKAAATKANARASSPDGKRSSTKASSNVETSRRSDPKPASAQSDQLRVQDGSVIGGAVVADASLAALAVPRLKIESGLPSFDPPSGVVRVTDELQAAIAGERRARLLNTPIEEDLSPRLEADLVVTKRRLAELQAQLSAAGLTAKSDASAASTGMAVGTAAVAKSGAVAAPAARWDWRGWLWIPGVLLVLGLLGFLWRQRSSQRQAQTFPTASATDDPPGLLDQDAFETSRTEYPLSAASVPINETAAVKAPPVRALVSPARKATAPQSASPASSEVNPLLRVPSTANVELEEASDRLNNPLFQLRDTNRHVDVTELSQVTDEAQVYVDLGRSDQAIEILRDHIESQTSEHDSPAAWLMIFDLYRRTNNRAGYDELAPKFRTHFNGRMPDWDNYGHELALDDGLEAFPHLVAILQRDWGTPEARKFLEELLYDNRGGSRLGFSLAAYRDILLLLQVHEALEGEKPAASIDWESRGANDDDGTPKWDLSLDMLEPPKVGELESFLRNRPPDEKS